MQHITFVGALNRILRALSVIVMLAGLTPARAADAGFAQFIASLWPEAQAAGVSRATFDAQTSGLEPDYKLPDLILPGRPATGHGRAAAAAEVSARACRNRSALRGARYHRARDLGPRDRLRPLYAAL